jgi:hypothetical protein
LARARQETNPTVRREFESLAAGYMRLALQADINSQNKIVLESRPQMGGPQSQPVQQQQSKLQKKPEE